MAVVCVVFVVLLVVLMLVGDVDGEGVPVFGTLSLSLIAVILLVPVAGYVQALVLRKRDRKAYERITEAISG